MGSFKKLKICKIESKAFAKYCIKRGVDYLGVHVIKFALDSELKELCNFIAIGRFSFTMSFDSLTKGVVWSDSW